MEDVENIIKSRHSVRSFTDKKIEGKTKEDLEKAIDECNKKSSLNFQLVLDEENAFGKSHYGSFKNCKNYIVIIGKKDDKQADELAGYYGEAVVLKAQELGLNTCWVALTYKKSEVPCELKDDEKIIIVIALGYGENSGSEHKMKSFEKVSKTDLANVPKWYQKGIEYALYAPTAMNQQKFKFELKDENIVSIKPGLGPYTKVDAGIARYHFTLGAGAENFEWA